MHDLTIIDIDHPDTEILSAFANAMQMRARGYAADDRGELWDDSRDKLAQEYERSVIDNHATTPLGVAAQLVLALLGIDALRRLDRGMCEQGFAAVYAARDDLELAWHDKQLVIAASELIHMEWEQTLAAYRRATDDFNEALDLKADVEAEVIRVQDECGTPAAFLDQMIARSDALEERFCNASALHRMIRTLTPDFDAYRVKAGICIQTGFSAEAAPWLLRDANYLSGKIEREEVAA